LRDTPAGRSIVPDRASQKRPTPSPATLASYLRPLQISSVPEPHAQREATSQQVEQRRVVLASRLRERGIEHRRNERRIPVEQILDIAEELDPAARHVPRIAAR